MRPYTVNVKEKELTLKIWEALVDDYPHPATIEFTTIDITEVRQWIQLDFLTFKPEYVDSSSHQWLLAKLKQEQGGIEIPAKTQQYELSILPHEKVAVVIEGVPMEIERFKLFRYLSEVGALRLPENYINGLTAFATEQEFLFPNVPNPVYIDRTGATKWPRFEPFDQQYNLYQPYVVELHSVTNKEGDTLGSIAFKTWQFTGAQEYSINDGPLTPFTGDLVLSDLEPNTYNIVIKDSSLNSEYNFVIIIEEEIAVS